MSDCIERQLWNDVLKVATAAHCTAVRIYNTIREVGYKKLSADNALHQMVEDYKNLHDLGDNCQIVWANLPYKKEENE